MVFTIEAEVAKLAGTCLVAGYPEHIHRRNLKGVRDDAIQLEEGLSLGPDELQARGDVDGSYHRGRGREIDSTYLVAGYPEHVHLQISKSPYHVSFFVPVWQGQRISSRHPRERRVKA
jgi:hypothetical protein